MRILSALLVGVLVCFSATGTTAHGVKTRTIEIVHPWTFGLDPDGQIRVGMKIKNIGSRADRLMGVVTGEAQSASLVETVTHPEANTRAIKSIEIAAGGNIELLPSGRSIVLTGFKKEVGPYYTFPLTLVFQHAGRIQIEVLVEERAGNIETRR